jgi:uncharacterized RDD family membrane protein YckC
MNNQSEENTNNSLPPPSHTLKQISEIIPSVQPIKIVTENKPTKHSELVEKTTDSATTETTEPTIALFHHRLVAAAIDLVIVIGAYLIISIVFPSWLRGVGTLLGIGYLITRDSLPFLEGQSIGKKAMNLKVVKENDESIKKDWITGLIRNISLVIPLFGFIEIFVLFKREDQPKRGLRFGDEWAKTKVIEFKAAISNSNITNT